VNKQTALFRAEQAARLRAQGADDFTDRQLLQFLLSYALPAEVAEHRATALFDTFGTLHAVLTAPEAALREQGLPDHAALLLSLVLQVRAFVAEHAARGVRRFDKAELLGRYLVEIYAPVRVETVYLCLLDAQYKLLDTVRVAEGSVNSANLNIRRMVERALEGGASFAVVAHNHPSGNTQPSSQDLATTARLHAAFSVVGITLLEHILVAGNRFVPLILHAPDPYPPRPDFYTEPPPAPDPR